MSTPAILTVNLGSSSVKLALFSADGRERLAQRDVGGVGSTEVLAALDATLDRLLADAGDAYRIATIGHRIVHGGTRFRSAQHATPALLQELEALDPLAPQHQPFNIAGARRLQARFPDSRAIACFDTAFHAGWDDATARLAIPRRLHDAGVRRYGFHGLSYQFLSGKLQREAPRARRAVLAHLGSGASLCALRDGRSVDCTMGFSVLDGLPMATRSGAIDPGVVFHLHRQYGLDFDAIEHLLYYDSGLNGMSGHGGDVRELLRLDDTAAREAIAVFVHRCVREIGAMVAVLGGIDALVFSGGIGAQAAAVRAAIGARLGAFGIVLDAAANDANDATISAAASHVPVHAWPTDEEAVIAAQCAECTTA